MGFQDCKHWVNGKIWIPSIKSGYKWIPKIKKTVVPF